MEYLKSLQLDVNADNNYRFVRAKQGDKVCRKLAISLLKDGEELSTGGVSSATFRCAKPDGTAVVIAGIIPSDDVFTVELTEQCLAVAGRCICDLALLDSDSNVLSTATFVLDVIPMPDIGNAVESETEWIQLQEAIEAAENFASILAFRSNNGNIEYTTDNTNWVVLCALGAVVEGITDEEIDALFNE